MAPRPDLFQLCPGRETISASRPRQLGYSQGAGGCGKMGGCAITMGELGEKERGVLDESETLVFFFIFSLFLNSYNFRTTRIWHFAVFNDKKPLNLDD